MPIFALQKGSIRCANKVEDKNSNRIHYKQGIFKGFFTGAASEQRAL